MKLDENEQKIVRSVARDERRPMKGWKQARNRYARYAGSTPREDRRISIRISTKDLKALRKRALEVGLVRQSPISQELHEYATGRLREK